MADIEKRVFWLEDANSGQGGYFIRSELGPFLAKLRAAGKTAVGIVVEGDSRNIEVLVNNFATPPTAEDGTDD